MKKPTTTRFSSPLMHLSWKLRRFTLSMAGFTLVELLISVAIVAVLAAIAVPSYTGYIARARRAEARTHLVEAAQFMQRFYAANDNFLRDRSNNSVVDQMPASLKSSPSGADDGTQLYNLDIPLGLAPLTNAMSFTLRMVPVAGGVMSNDMCETFTLTSIGIRGVSIAG